MRVEHQPPRAGFNRVQTDSAVKRALISCVVPAGTVTATVAPGTSENTVELVAEAALSARFCICSWAPPAEPDSTANAVPPVTAKATIGRTRSFFLNFMSFTGGIPSWGVGLLQTAGRWSMQNQAGRRRRPPGRSPVQA